MALAVVRTRASDGKPGGDTVALWREADSNLRMALQLPHPILRYLDEIGGPARSDEDAIRMLARAASGPFPGNLFFP